MLISSNTSTGIYWRTATSLSGGWKKLLDSTNYTDYTVTKGGSGATGTWGINISGNANSATSANYLNLYEARGTTTTLNKPANYVGAGKMFHLVASSSTSATDNGKTPTDANILQMNWDNNGGYDSQFGISTSGSRAWFRSQASAKTAWREVVTSTPGTAAGSSIKPVYISTTGVATATEEMFPVRYSNLDFTSTAPAPGAYKMDAQTHPVTGVTEYGSSLSLPGIATNTKHYAS